MARPQKPNKTIVDPSGMSIADIIDLDPTHMKNLSERSYARLTSRLVSAVNKRLARLEKAGLAESSPAYRGVVKSLGANRLSVRGLDRNQVASVFAYAQQLLTERKTLSIGGTRKFRSETERRLGHVFATEGESESFWKTIDLLKERGFGVTKVTSDDVQRNVVDMMFNEGKSMQEILAEYGVIEEAETPDLAMETEALMEMGDEDGEETDGEDEYDPIFDY